MPLDLSSVKAAGSKVGSKAKAVATARASNLRANKAAVMTEAKQSGTLLLATGLGSGLAGWRLGSMTKTEKGRADLADGVLPLGVPGLKKLGPVSDARLLVGAAGSVYTLSSKKINPYVLAGSVGLLASWLSDLTETAGYNMATKEAGQPAHLFQRPSFAAPAAAPVVAPAAAPAAVPGSGRISLIGGYDDVGRSEAGLKKQEERLIKRLAEVRAQLHPQQALSQMGHESYQHLRRGQQRSGDLDESGRINLLPAYA